MEMNVSGQKRIRFHCVDNSRSGIQRSSLSLTFVIQLLIIIKSDWNLELNQNELLILL